MRFEEALEAMRKGKKAKRARWSNSSAIWIDKESNEMYTDDKPCDYTQYLSFEEITADDWVVISDVPPTVHVDGAVPINNTDIPETKDDDMYKSLEITFKSGETIKYGEGEWDDYAYDGKSVTVKLNGAWIGIYNFDNVFCVELKKRGKKLW